VGNVFAHDVPLIHARRCKGVGWLIKNEQQRNQKERKTVSDRKGEKLREKEDPEDKNKTKGGWTERREEGKGGRRSRREPPGLPPRSPLYPPKTGARGGVYDQRKKTRGRAVPKSDQVLVALRLLWISGWA